MIRLTPAGPYIADIADVYDDFSGQFFPQSPSIFVDVGVTTRDGGEPRISMGFCVGPVQFLCVKCDESKTLQQIGPS